MYSTKTEKMLKCIVDDFNNWLCLPLFTVSLLLVFTGMVHVNALEKRAHNEEENLGEKKKKRRNLSIGENL